MVRKLARELSIDLAAVAGTGPQGRVTADDVHVGGGPIRRQPVCRTRTPATEVVPLTPTRRAIAENITRRQGSPRSRPSERSTAPRWTRSEQISGFPRFPVWSRRSRAIVATHSTLNSMWTPNGIRRRLRIHVGIAADTERGLVVPVLRDAQTMRHRSPCEIEIRRDSQTEPAPRPCPRSELRSAPRSR